MITKMTELAKNEEGANLVEYALLVALVAVACVTVITTLSGKIQGTFTKASNAMPQ
jgi:pilus assembly protein Flp/PilA